MNTPLSVDILNIEGLEQIGPELEALLEQGKTQRTRILRGTELAGPPRNPFARTEVEVRFDNEADLRECVRLLRWSDARLAERPDQLIRWSWDDSVRDGMTIYFGVNWYRRDFFERRKDAFLEPSHGRYYALFGKKPGDFKVSHKILASSSA